MGRHLATHPVGPPGSSHGGNPPNVPAWFPKDSAPEDPGAKSPDLAAAREFVARTKGLSAGKVEAMPPAQVLLLTIAGTCREDWDDYYWAAYLTYAQARPFSRPRTSGSGGAHTEGPWCHAPLFRHEQGHVQTDRTRPQPGRLESHRGIAD